MRGIAMDLGEMLAAASRGHQHGEDDRPSSPPDVLCVTLKEIEQRYRLGCTFKPGDLVTPRRGYIYKGHGEPCVVVDVLAKPVVKLDVENFSGIGDACYGMRIDMRVLRQSKGDICGFWVESWCFEKYTGPIAEMHPGA